MSIFQIWRWRRPEEIINPQSNHSTQINDYKRRNISKSSRETWKIFSSERKDELRYELVIFSYKEWYVDSANMFSQANQS